MADLSTYPLELSYPEKQKEEEKPMSNLVNGWYKCTKSNEKCRDGSWAWIAGKYYYFKNGHTTDERGALRPRNPFDTAGASGLWLKYCFLIPVIWFNGCPVKLKDSRTGKITICEGEMIEIQLDDEYDIPSFVNVTPNEFEVNIPADHVFKKMREQIQKMMEQIQRLNESMRKFNGFVVNLNPFEFKIPKVGMHIRDKKTLKVWRVKEVKLPECCCEENPCHGGYAELQLMTTTPASETAYDSFINEPVTFTANTMLHETDLEHFWDNYEEYEDLGWSGMYFDRECNCGKGKIITVYCGQINPGSYDNGRRFKSFEEIKEHIPNIIKVDSTTYCEQKDPSDEFFTGYALCIKNTGKYPEKGEYCISGISVGKIYCMNCGRFFNDYGNLDTCNPFEFDRYFVEVHDLE